MKKNMVRVNKWPYECKAAFNINLDDIHPERNIDGIDCGGDLEKGVFKFIVNMLQVHPYVKITFFVTPNWIFKEYVLAKFYQKMFRKPVSKWSPILCNISGILGKVLVKKWENGMFRLDLERHDKFATWMRDGIYCGWLEVANHGLYHFQETFPYKAEFAHLDYNECKHRLIEANKIFVKAKIPCSKGMRAPSYAYTENLCRALDGLGYVYFANSADYKTSPSENAKCSGLGLKNLSLIFPDVYRPYNFLALPANYAMGTSAPSRAFKIISSGGLVSLKGHIEDEYGGSSIASALTRDNYNKTIKLLRKINKRYGRKIWYATLENIAKFWLARLGTSLKIERFSNFLKMECINNSRFPANGLTLSLQNKDLNIKNIRCSPKTYLKIISPKTFSLNIPSQTNIVLKVLTKK